MTTAGNQTFPNVGLTIKLPTTGSYPSGGVTAYRINSKPYLPPSDTILNNYWIVRNWGTSKTFTALDSVVFSGISLNAADLCNPANYRLYIRPQNSDKLNWTMSDIKASKNQPSGKVWFAGNEITTFGQYLISHKDNYITAPILSGGAIVCQPNSVTLTATGCAGTITWSDAAASTGTSLLINTVGTFNYTATCTVNGCVSDASAAQSGEIQQQPQKPNILPSSSIICSTDNVVLVAICPNNTLMWSNGQTESFITVGTITTTTNYTVICTSNMGCSSEKSDPSVVNVVTTPAKPTITPSGTTTICIGNSLTLIASPCSGILKWSYGSTSTNNTLVISPQVPTNYTVTCNNILGVTNCVSVPSDTVMININTAPTAPKVSDVIIASGGTASLTASCTSGTPVWYATSNTSSSLAMSSYTTPPLYVNTTYYIACEVSPGSSSQNCGSFRQKQTVIIDNFVLVNQPSDIYVCTGQNAYFSIGATGLNITYQWQENNGTDWKNLSNDGIYSGVNSTSLNLKSPPLSMDAYQYRCVITNSLSPKRTITSNVAFLAIHTSALAYHLVIDSPLTNLKNSYQAVQIISATNKIQSNTRIDYFAGSYIILNPGFEVKAQDKNIFRAKIAVPCTNTATEIPNILKK